MEILSRFLLLLAELTLEAEVAWGVVEDEEVSVLSHLLIFLCRVNFILFFNFIL